MLIRSDIKPPAKKRIANLSGFACPKCNDRFLVFFFKVLASRGYSCQTCGYTFMVSIADLTAAGRERKALVIGDAESYLAARCSL